MTSFQSHLAAQAHGTCKVASHPGWVCTRLRSEETETWDAVYIAEHQYATLLFGFFFSHLSHTCQCLHNEENQPAVEVTDQIS